MKSIFSEDYSKIIKKIKRTRIAKGYSQKSFAEKLGNTQSYISKLETGQVRLDIIQLKKISKILGLKIEELL